MVEYSYSTDQETYFEKFGSREEAISAAFAEAPDTDICWTAEVDPILASDLIDDRRLIADVQELAWEAVGESSEDYLEGLTKEDKAELKELIATWMEGKDPVTFWKTKDGTEQEHRREDH